MVVQVTRLLATDIGREHTKRYDCLLFSPPFKRAIGRLGHCPDSGSHGRSRGIRAGEYPRPCSQLA